MTGVLAGTSMTERIDDRPGTAFARRSPLYDGPNSGCIWRSTPICMSAPQSAQLKFQRPLARLQAAFRQKLEVAGTTRSQRWPTADAGLSGKTRRGAASGRRLELNVPATSCHWRQAAIRRARHAVQHGCVDGRQDPGVGGDLRRRHVRPATPAPKRPPGASAGCGRGSSPKAIRQATAAACSGRSMWASSPSESSMQLWLWSATTASRRVGRSIGRVMRLCRVVCSCSWSCSGASKKNGSPAALANIQDCRAIASAAGREGFVYAGERAVVLNGPAAPALQQ